MRARPNGHDPLSAILYFPFRSTNYPVPSSKSRLPTLPNLLQNQEGVLIQSYRTRDRSSILKPLISTPLLLTRDSVAVAVHLSAGTASEEELRFIAGCHLGATRPAVASILHGCRRRRDWLGRDESLRLWRRALHVRLRHSLLTRRNGRRRLRFWRGDWRGRRKLLSRCLTFDQLIAVVSEGADCDNEQAYENANRRSARHIL